MASKKPNYWKIGIIAAAAIALFMLGRGCGIKSVLKDVGSDTTITKDSIQFVSVPTPVSITRDSIVFRDGKLVEVIIHDTLPGDLIVRVDPADTTAIIRRLFQTASYDTTVNLKADTVKVTATVSMNRVTQWGVKIKSQDTAIKTTVVLKPPKPLVVSFTASVIGNIQNPFYGQGGGLTLKLPNEATYSAQIFNVSGHKPMVQVTKTWPIRLRKK